MVVAIAVHVVKVVMLAVGVEEVVGYREVLLVVLVIDAAIAKKLRHNKIVVYKRNLLADPTQAL